MRTILVIEDKIEVRENIVEMLELAQYRVVQAADGKRGVELARSASPDLILCDIMMPDLDGYGVLHILRKEATTAGIPFIFLSAKADPAHFRSGMDLGADDYLTKPFDDIALLNAVEMRLKKNAHTRQQINVDALTNLLEAVRNQDTNDPNLGERYPMIRYLKKQLLFEEGSFPKSLYFIRRGQLKRFKRDDLGNELITNLSGEGDFVGYTALLENTPYRESAEVLTDTDVCAIPKAEFLTLLAHNPDIAGHFLRLLVTELAERDERLLKLAYQPVRRRVVEALLLVQRKFYSTSPLIPSEVQISESPGSDRSADQPALPMALPRETWSHLVGASTETVIRTLSELRAEGLIDLKGSQITILDLPKLARLKH